MSKKKDKELKKIAEKIVDDMFGYLMTVDSEHFDYAVRFMYATALRAMLDTLGKEDTKLWMIDCMIQMNMVSIEKVNKVFGQVQQEEMQEEIRPQSETLH